MSEDCILELARLEREALARCQRRLAEQQLGEAFTTGQGDAALVRDRTTREAE